MRERQGPPKAEGGPKKGPSSVGWPRQQHRVRRREQLALPQDLQMLSSDCAMTPFTGSFLGALCKYCCKLERAGCHGSSAPRCPQHPSHPSCKKNATLPRCRGLQPQGQSSKSASSVAENCREHFRFLGGLKTRRPQSSR